MQDRRSACCARPAKASIAAEPVSPEVAPTMVIGAPRRGQEMLEQPRQQLQRDVLERERRPVEQLEQPLVRPELAERRDRGMVEGGIGRVDQSGELVRAQLIADERPQHRAADLLVGSALQRVQRVALEPRPGLGQIQPAIGSARPANSAVLETTSRHAAAGADVAQITMGIGSYDQAPSARVMSASSASGEVAVLQEGDEGCRRQRPTGAPCSRADPVSSAASPARGHWRAAKPAADRTRRGRSGRQVRARAAIIASNSCAAISAPSV